MMRDYARAPRGERVEYRTPRNRGCVLTMIGAISIDGIETIRTVEGGTTGAVFLAFVRNDLLPCLAPGDVVVMDNLGAHHATGVRALIESVGASVLYMPPYSPDLNPIELAWSKLKSVLKKIGARTKSTLRAAVDVAARTITTSDSLGWFAHVLESTQRK
jgi:transposase